MEVKLVLGVRISPDMQIPTSCLPAGIAIVHSGPGPDLPPHPALGVDDLAQPTDTTALDRYPYSKRFMTCKFTLAKEASCPLSFASLFGPRKTPPPSINKLAGPTTTHITSDSG